MVHSVISPFRAMFGPKPVPKENVRAALLRNTAFKGNVRVYSV